MRTDQSFRPNPRPRHPLPGTRQRTGGKSGEAWIWGVARQDRLIRNRSIGDPADLLPPLFEFGNFTAIENDGGWTILAN
jgi:hypothetical protein